LSRASYVALMLLLPGRHLLAQEPATAAPTQKQVPVSQTVKLGSLDLALNWRARVEHWDWFEGPTGNSNYAFGHSQLRVGLGQKRSRVDWLVEAEQVVILGLPTDAVASAALGQLGLGATYYAANGNRENDANAFVKQAYAQWKQLGPTSLKLGRFEFFDGAEAKSADSTVTTLVQTRIAHRLISNFGFTAVQRTFDGAQFAWSVGPNNVTAFAARPTEGIFQVNGMGELDVQVYYGAYNKWIKTRNGAGSLRVFGVGYVDTRSTVLKTDNRSAAARTADHGDIKIGTWGADYVHVFHTRQSGTFDVLGWGVLQTGTWGNLTQRAEAFVGELGWQAPTTTLKPWVSAGYSYGSGDADPNDSRHGTFFQLLTTPRQYARFPFYNMMNNEDAYATLNLRPAPKLALRSELHGLRLADAADLWYLGGGAFQQSTFGYQGRPSNGSRNLSTVWDVSGDYQLTRFLTATLYYAHASGNGAIASIYPKDSDGHLAYVETTVHF
jgi:alginate export protein